MIDSNQLLSHYCSPSVVNSRCSQFISSSSSSSTTTTYHPSTTCLSTIETKLMVKRQLVGSKKSLDGRKTANARERARMKVLSKAFSRLKSSLPWVPNDTKLSKLDTLRLALRYINYLAQLLTNHSSNHPNSPDETSNCFTTLTTWANIQQFEDYRVDSECNIIEKMEQVTSYSSLTSSSPSLQTIANIDQDIFTINLDYNFTQSCSSNVQLTTCNL